MVYKYFDKKTNQIADKSAFNTNKNNYKVQKWTRIISENKELAKELHKPVIRKFEKWKIHLPIIDNIWVAGLADIQLLSKLDNGIRF